MMECSGSTPRTCSTKHWAPLPPQGIEKSDVPTLFIFVSHQLLTPGLLRSYCLTPQPNFCVHVHEVYKDLMFNPQPLKFLGTYWIMAIGGHYIMLLASHDLFALQFLENDATESIYTDEQLTYLILRAAPLASEQYHSWQRKEDCRNSATIPLGRYTFKTFWPRFPGLLHTRKYLGLPVLLYDAVQRWVSLFWQQFPTWLHAS